MHARKAILTHEMLTKPLVMSFLEVKQISHSRDVMDLLLSVTKRIAWLPGKRSDYNYQEKERMQIARTVKQGSC